MGVGGGCRQLGFGVVLNEGGVDMFELGVWGVEVCVMCVCLVCV